MTEKDDQGRQEREPRLSVSLASLLSEREPILSSSIASPLSEMFPLCLCVSTLFFWPLLIQVRALVTTQSCFMQNLYCLWIPTYF